MVLLRYGKQKIEVKADLMVTKKYWVIAAFVSIIVMLFISGCSIHAMSTNVTFAGLKEYQIKINQAGTIDVTGEPGADYNFSKWEDIQSVTVSAANAAGVKKDGTVYVTGNNDTGACNVSDWRDIVMVKFTLNVAYGLKNDGTVVHTKSNDQRDIQRNAEVDKWTDIVQIDASWTSVAGVKKDGTVVTTYPNQRGEMQSWRNIKSVCTSLVQTAGLTNDGRILATRNMATNESYTKPFDELRGAVKIGLGQTYMAGLMPDGTVKVRSLIQAVPDMPILGTDQTAGAPQDIDLLNDSLKKINEARDIVDIYMYQGYMAALKKDGTIMTGDEIDPNATK